jgi:hypothetical protein
MDTGEGPVEPLWDVSGHIMQMDYPQPVVEWDWFGDESTMIIRAIKPISRWKRFWLWLFFGSKFRDL